MKKTILTLFMATCLFPMVGFASGGGTGPGIIKFINEARLQNLAIAGKFVSIDNEDNVEFQLKAGQNVEQFVESEPAMEADIPEVVEALSRSEQNNKSFELILEKLRQLQ